MNATPTPLRDLHWQAALIDLDGTLVDTVGDFELALNGMLDDLGLPRVARPFIARTVGKGSEYLIRRTLEHVGGDAGRYDEGWARYQHHYEVVNGRASDVFPGVREGVAALKSAGLKLVCLTNKPGAPAKALVAAKGLGAMFEATYGGDAFARRKPDPMPLVEACRALGTAPARTLMLGDSVNDVLAARGAGCPVVLVRYGYNHGEPVEAAGADAVVDSIADVPALLGLG